MLIHCVNIRAIDSCPGRRSSAKSNRKFIKTQLFFFFREKKKKYTIKESGVSHGRCDGPGTTGKLVPQCSSCWSLFSLNRAGHLRSTSSVFSSVKVELLLCHRPFLICDQKPDQAVSQHSFFEVHGSHSISNISLHSYQN